MRDGRDDVFDSRRGLKKTVTIVADRRGYFGEVQDALSKRAVLPGSCPQTARAAPYGNSGKRQFDTASVIPLGERNSTFDGRSLSKVLLRYS